MLPKPLVLQHLRKKTSVAAAGRSPHQRRCSHSNFIFAKPIKTNEILNSDLLKKLKLINKNSNKLKILGTGEIKDKIDIEADLASKSAIEKLEKIGGSIQLKK